MTIETHNSLVLFSPNSIKITRMRLIHLHRLRNSIVLVGIPTLHTRSHWHIHPQTILDGIYGRVLPRRDCSSLSTEFIVVCELLSL